jgi:hypothetical protein
MTLLDAMYAAWIMPRSFEATESGARRYVLSIYQRSGAGAVKEISSKFHERATNDNFLSLQNCALSSMALIIILPPRRSALASITNGL